MLSENELRVWARSLGPSSVHSPNSPMHLTSSLTFDFCVCKLGNGEFALSASKNPVCVHTCVCVCVCVLEEELLIWGSWIEFRGLWLWIGRKLLFFFFFTVLGPCCSVGFSLVSVSGGYSLICSAQESVVAARGLSSCGSQALEHKLSSCGTES